jgi:hypothetical protein
MQLKKSIRTFSKLYHGSDIDEMCEDELKKLSQLIHWEIQISYWFFCACKGTGIKADKLGQHILFLYDACEYVYLAYRRRVARRLISESAILQKYIQKGVISNHNDITD